MRKVLGVAVLVMFLVVPSAYGAKYNLTRVVASTLVAGHEAPTTTDCKIPGVCFPVNQTLPGQSLWYWCGFWSTHKTIYSVKSTSASTNISATWLARRHVVENCAIPNLATVENCPVVPESSTSKLDIANVRLFGLVFPDELCLVVINNKASNLTVTVKVNNFYSRPRYYGTVFTIFLAVVGLSCVIAKVSYDIYKGIITPINRHKEPVRPRRNRDLTEQLLDGDAEKGKPSQSAVSDNTQAVGNPLIERLRAYFVRHKSEA